MAERQEDEASREHAPTQRRLDEARRRGEVARSADLAAAASLAGLTGLIIIAGAWLVTQAAAAMAGLMAQADEMAIEGGGTSLAGALLRQALLPLAAFVVVPFLAALLAQILQGGLAFNAERLRMNWSHVSPLSNARQKFGIDGLFSFAKSTVKMLAVGAVLVLFLSGRLPQILATSQLSVAGSSQVLFRQVTDFLLVILCVTLVIGAVDYVWQVMRRLARLRMSREELKEEMRDSEGDPHVRAQRRQRGHDIATNRMLLDVPRADVVIVNPSHYAVALKWERGRGKAPACVAKGVDEVAARIREAAALAGVPIHRDPPTARALHASVEIGQQVRPEHYRAVAAAIRFAEAMRRQRRKTWR